MKSGNIFARFYKLLLNIIMDRNVNIQNYLLYLKFLDEKFNKFFNQQKPYIFCYKGCGKCCKNALFPYSEVEIQFLLMGTLTLNPETQSIINKNIENLLIAKHNCKDETFYYDCPFLIDNICSVYEHRGIICRAFGLMTQSDEGDSKVPFCAFEGLNYSNVVDTETSRVSRDKYEKLGIENEPLAYNVSYKFLTDEDVESAFHFQFGPKKCLIDWFDNN